MMRYPAVSGMFYDSERDSLLASLRRCFLSPRGPGELPDENNRGSSRRIKGIVVPHAGYIYSGEIAAHAYLQLWKDGIPDTVIIIGPNHYSSMPAIALSAEDYRTPLGDVEIDRRISSMIEGDPAEVDDISQSSEHSIEVQLPFLQFMNPEVKFVPVCMGAQDSSTALLLGRRLRDIAARNDTVIIASTDFSHYVRPEEARTKDMIAIAAILRLDPSSFLDTVCRHRVSMCGYGPVAAMLEATKGSEGVLLSYGHSGEVQRMESVVGYGAIKVV